MSYKCHLNQNCLILKEYLESLFGVDELINKYGMENDFFKDIEFNK